MMARLAALQVAGWPEKLGIWGAVWLCGAGPLRPGGADQRLISLRALFWAALPLACHASAAPAHLQTFSHLDVSKRGLVDYVAWQVETLLGGWVCRVVWHSAAAHVRDGKQPMLRWLAHMPCRRQPHPACGCCTLPLVAGSAASRSWTQRPLLPAAAPGAPLLVSNSWAGR